MTLERPTYLVVGLRGVARLDLVGAIESANPAAEIRVVKSLSDAAAALRDGAGVLCAFIGAAPAALRESPLADVLRRSAARIVFLGQEAEDEADAVTCAKHMVLHRPYGSDEILAALEFSR